MGTHTRIREVDREENAPCFLIRAKTAPNEKQAANQGAVQSPRLAARLTLDRVEVISSSLRST